MGRDMNITLTCVHCGEVLDTNDAQASDIEPGGTLTEGLELHPGTLHFCSECGACVARGHHDRCSEAPAEFSNYQE